MNKIDLKEFHGYFAVELNGHVIAYGLTKDQAGFLISGIEWGICELRGIYEKNDLYYEIMSV